MFNYLIDCYEEIKRIMLEKKIQRQRKRNHREMLEGYRFAVSTFLEEGDEVGLSILENLIDELEYQSQKDNYWFLAGIETAISDWTNSEDLRKFWKWQDETFGEKK